MSKTTTMRLLELMVYKEDIQNVLAYLGKLGEFQFQDDVMQKAVSSAEQELFNRLENVRVALDVQDLTSFIEDVHLPDEQDAKDAEKLIAMVDSLHERELHAQDELKRVTEAHTEALAFGNLQVPYSQLESLSFLTLRIGKIPPEKFEELKFALGQRVVLVKLGNDASRVMVACPNKARFFADAELKKVGFVEIEISKDFKGIPEDVLEKLSLEKESAEKALAGIQDERRNFAETHKDMLYHLLQVYSVGGQIAGVKGALESTDYVYRLTGWLPAYRIKEFIRDIDKMTAGRTGIRNFLPTEVPSVASGSEKVPVHLKHGKILQNFERMIFSYGSPLYGTIDPTPFVAIFFTLLFGIMFGDAGQGLVFLIIGILMTKKIIKLGGWEKFNIIFIAIGISSTIMGILTGEFFANGEILRPLSRFITGLFGTPRDEILPMMPSSDPSSIKRMFLFFGFTVGVGFIINTTGLIVNIVNQFSLKRMGRALFGKTGLSGAIFFWYVIAFALRIAFFHHVPNVIDWIIIAATLLMTAFCEPLERVVEHENPVFENGVFAAVIGALVEVIEVFSSYLSNTVSFLRVGAFALAHAVLGYIIEMLVEATPSVGGLLVCIIGNAIVVVLEGMIVCIQVVRLQYYEFFSKFFTETGREFSPFSITYGALAK
ncbi:MAG: ATPase [Treponema sp.]|nr:ATPase [Treponema sp.]